MLELSNKNNWQLIYADRKQAVSRPRLRDYEPIQDFKVFCDATTIAVGAYNPKAYYNWQLGAWCYVTLPTSPSNSANLQDLQLNRYTVPLNGLAVYEIADLSAPPYTLLFKVPKWHQELYLEVWAYLKE
jgi:hypothetical protein